MSPAATNWSYLELDGDLVVLRSRAEGATIQFAAKDGDYCGEWGAVIGRDGKPEGVRVFFFFDYLPNHPITSARNCTRFEDELRIHFEDDRLPDLEGMPFLPVYRNARPQAQDIFQLSGYDE